MRADATALDVAQFVRQRFRHHLHARLRDIVGRVPGRTGDALLRARVDDRRGRPLLDHVGAKAWTPLITPQRLTSICAASGPDRQTIRPPPPVPALFISTATSPKASIDRGFQAPDVLEAADVDGEGSHIVRLRRGRADLGGAGLQRLAAQVRHAHFHAERGEFGRSGQANAAGRSGDDRDPVRGQCGMIGQLKSSDPGSRARLHHAKRASAIVALVTGLAPAAVSGAGARRR